MGDKVRRSGRAPQRHVSPAATRTPGQVVGDLLFNSLFTGPVRSLFDQSLGLMYGRQCGLRIKLHIDPEDPSLAQLASLPWEFLYRKENREFLNLSLYTPIVRYLDVQRPYSPLPLEPPLRILVVISDPDDYPQLDLHIERARIEASWARQEAVQVDFLEEATIPALQDRLRKPYHVLHFMGHGDFDERSGEGVMVMKDEDGCGALVSGDKLGILLRDVPTMRLVFLNACETATLSPEEELDPFAGVATATVMSGISAVVAMQFPISDYAAVTFARQVYSLLAQGYPVDYAVTEARKAVSLAVPNTMEWGTPVLFMRAPNGIIFQAAEPRVRKEPADRAWSWPLLGLLALILLIGVVVVGVFGSELMGGGEEPSPIPTTSVPLVAEARTHTPRPATANPTPAPFMVDTPPSTPTPSPTATLQRPSPTPTKTPVSPTRTPTKTPMPPTGTPTATPTATNTRAPTATPTSSSSPTPTLGIGSTLVREKDGMEMVYVPGGTFQMGSADAEVDAAFKQCEQDIGSGNCNRSWFERESPWHSVTLDGIWIDKAVVTNEQFARCVADGACSPLGKSSSYTHDSYYGNSQYDDYPVIYVDWDDARSYCEWVGGRLPTEAEWEYAARGSDRYIYPWGNAPPDDTLLNYNHNVGDTTKVGSYPDGASWAGALDMAGNVWEWVADWWGEYPSTAQTNPTGPETGDEKVLRGGSWNYDPFNMRSAIRYGDYPDVRYNSIGFRCVVASASSP